MTSDILLNNVERALDEIRPFLHSDGGDITLIRIEDGKQIGRASCRERV